MIVLDHKLVSLRADAGDRFEGCRHLYPNGKPITRLRFLGERGGRFYYVAADDRETALSAVPIIVGGKLAGRAQ